MKFPAVEVIGHAGAAGFHPQNSADSILKAIDLGVDRIEVDVLSTSEDVLILVHDKNLLFEERRQATAHLSLDQLRTALPGALTLQEAAELTHGRIPLLIDIKGRHFVGPLIEAIREASPPDQISVCSTHARVLRQLRRKFPDMSLGLSRGHSLTRISNRRVRSIAGAVLSIGQIVLLIAVGKWCGANEVMIQHHICTSALVKAAHWAGLRVNAWTVDWPDDIRRVIEAGVDGVISNRPDLVFDEKVAGE